MFFVAKFKENVVIVWIKAFFEEVVEILLNSESRALPIVKNLEIPLSEQFDIFLIIFDVLRHTGNGGSIL